MPGFSETGISQISSVIRMTVMSVLSFMSGGRDLRDSRDTRDWFETAALPHNSRSSRLSRFQAALDVEYYARLPAITCLLKRVEMFRDPFDIGMQFLRFLIHRRTDETGAQ